MLGDDTYGVRQTDVAVGVVGAAAVNLVRVAGLLNYHRARLHRFWSTPYTQTHSEEKIKKREREAGMRNKSDKACVFKAYSQKTGLTAAKQKGKEEQRLTKLAG